MERLKKMNISQWPLFAPKIDFQNDIFMYIQQIIQYMKSNDFLTG